MMKTNEMSIKDLKAKAYDTIAIMEHLQKDLVDINKLIVSKVNDEKLAEQTKLETKT